MPPKPPTFPRAKRVRVCATRAAMRRLAAAAAERSTPAAAYRSVELKVHQVLERAHPGAHVGIGHLVEPLNAERLDGETPHGGAVYHGAAQRHRRGVVDAREVGHDPTGERVPRSRRIEHLL